MEGRMKQVMIDKEGRSDLLKNAGHDWPDVYLR